MAESNSCSTTKRLTMREAEDNKSSSGRRRGSQDNRLGHVHHFAVEQCMLKTAPALDLLADSDDDDEAKASRGSSGELRAAQEQAQEQKRTARTRFREHVLSVAKEVDRLNDLPVVKLRASGTDAMMEENEDAMNGKNFRFYSNALRCMPDRKLIDEIHESWQGDYEGLEARHGYIQWLFPIYYDSGVNSLASKLSRAEARLMRRDVQVARRIVRSYRLMLDFYGLVLVDDLTGKVARSPDAAHVHERFQNLSWASHNNLRISRILTSLGQLGFGRYKAPLVRFFDKEVRRTKELRTYKKQTAESFLDQEESIFFAQR
eukprot:m51a1_g11022 hypothetical protein (318) ;mRNA; r:406871-409123